MTYYDVTVVQSALVPRWWQVRYRLRRWRQRRRHDAVLARMSPHERELVELYEKELDRELIFGPRAF